MARRCASKMLLDVLDETRMRTLAPDVRMLWLDIARTLQRDGISVFRFGSEILSLKGLSILITRPETETETELKTKITELCARGLLALEDDGAISCPMLTEAVTRSQINRANGLKGGRPRKDGQPPGQRHLMLPINGGADAKTEKTEPETQPGNVGSPTTTYLDRKSVVVSETEFRETGEAVLEAIGIDPARSYIDYGQVRQWLVDGADRALILDVVRTRNKPGEIRSLRYFDKAIAAAIANKPQAKPDWERRYDHDLAIWEVDGRGFRPMPRSTDYRPASAA